MGMTALDAIEGSKMGWDGVHGWVRGWTDGRTAVWIHTWVGDGWLGKYMGGSVDRWIDKKMSQQA